MSGTEPFGSIDFTALMLATEACAVGDCLVFDTAQGYWRVATDAHRASADAGAQAIARMAYGGSAIGKVTYQTAGVLPQSVTGLPALTPTTAKKLVRTSTEGRLERIDAYTTGDDIVGYATWDGRVALHLGLPWESIATFAGVAPSLPVDSIQAYGTSTSLRGAAESCISSDGAICMGTSRAGDYAATGDLRAKAGASWRVMSFHGSKNLALIRHYDNGHDTMQIGQNEAGEKVYRLGVYSEVGASIIAGESGGAYLAYLSAVGPGNYPSPADTMRGIEANPNLYLIQAENLNALANSLLADPAGGGKGYVALQYLATAGAGNPPAGFTRVYADTSTGHVSQQLPDGTVFDLTATGGGPAKQQTVDITSGTATADLSDGKIIKLIGTHDGDVTVTITPQPSSNATADSFRLRNTTTSRAIVTNALGGKTTVAVLGMAYGVLDTTPDGIDGAVLDSTDVVDVVSP